MRDEDGVDTPVSEHHPIASAFTARGRHRLGFEVLPPRDGWFGMRAPWRTEIDSGADSGRIHRGLIMALADSACGLATMTDLDAPRMIATLELRLEFRGHEAPRAGVSAWAHCEQRSSEVAHLVARVEAAGTTLATATGLFSLAGPPPEGPEDDPLVLFGFGKPLAGGAPEPLPHHVAGNGQPGFEGFLDYRYDGDGASLPGGAHLMGNPVLGAYHGGLSAAFLDCIARRTLADTTGDTRVPETLAITASYLLPTRVAEPLAGSVTIDKIGRRFATLTAEGVQKGRRVLRAIVTCRRR